MSDLSRFLKRQESNIHGLYDKNLRSFVDKWRRPVLGAAAGLAPGAAMLAGGPALAAMAPSVMAAGGLAGGAAGYQRTQEREDQWAAAREREQQERAQFQAGKDLEDGLEPFLPGEENPEDVYKGPPGNEQPPIAIEPPLDQPPVQGPPPGQVRPPVEQPVLDQPSGPIGIPDIDPSMGNIDTGGSETGVGGILDEAERARKYQLDLINQQRTDKDTARAEMAAILNSQMDRQFDENKSGIYEDLNRRGMLRSTDTGRALAEERGRLSAGVNEQLGMQGIRDKYGSIDALTGVGDQYLGARQSGMQRKLSLEDWAREMKASKDLGRAVTPIQPYTGGGKSGSTQAGMAGAQLGLSLGK